MIRTSCISIRSCGRGALESHHFRQNLTDRRVLCKGFYSLVADKAETEVFFPSLSRCLLPNTPATLSLNLLLGWVLCANYVQNGEKDPFFKNYCYFLFLTVKRRKCGFTLLRSAKGLYNIYSKVFIWKLHLKRRRPQQKNKTKTKWNKRSAFLKCIENVKLITTTK